MACRPSSHWLLSSLLTLSAGLTVAAGPSGCNNSRKGASIDGSVDPKADMAEPVAAHGCKLSGSSQQLSNLTGQHGYPRIATSGGGYTVAWVSGIASTPRTFRIDVALADKTGNNLGPNIPLSATAIAASDPPSISPVTGGISVAWTRATGTTTDIVLSTLDSTGQKLDSAGKPCDPGDAACGITAITSSGLAHTPFLERPFGDQHITGPTADQLGVAFIDTRNYPCTTQPCSTSNDVFWKRVQTNGTELIFEKQLTQHGRFASPRLAFDGFHQGVVWRDITTGTSSDMFFLTIDNMGVASSSDIKIGTSSGTNAQSTPDIVWNGSDYAVISATGSETAAAIIYQRQASTGASTLSPRGVSFGGSTCTPAIAYDGTGYGVVYQAECGTAGSDLSFVHIDQDGVRTALDGSSCGDSVDPTCGVITASHDVRQGASQPQMVYGGDGQFAIVWMQGAAGADLSSGVPLEVYMQRISCL
ncbi:MAG: hypothetical protein ABI321_24985 [Polyangia bacterium]